MPIISYCFHVIHNLISLRRLAQKCHGSVISRRAIIEGNSKEIFLGKETIIEPGVVLSTEYGGSIKIGDNCVVRRGAMIMTYGGDIEIGRNCTVGPYAILYGHGGLRIGNYVMLAAHSVVIPADHTFEFLDTVIVNQPLVKKGITIEDDVWVGAGVKILDGVKVGCGAVIGAGSVVTRELIPFSVNVGVPSRIIKMRR